MLRFTDKKLHLAMLAGFLSCFALRLVDAPAPDIVISHISNFGITGALFMLAGFFLLRKPFTKRQLIIWLLPFALLNIVGEILIGAGTMQLGVARVSNFNTSDLLDVLFGIAALVLIYFVISQRSIKTTSHRA
jgi:hypothetical protein